MEIKKILVAVDGSEHSEKGLDIAISLVKETKKEILGLLLKKENNENTSIGSGVALPNIKLSNIEQSLGIFLKLNKPIHYNSIDNEPVDIILFLISPMSDLPVYLNELAYISRFLTKKKTLQNIRAALDKETIYAIMPRIKTRTLLSNTIFFSLALGKKFSVSCQSKMSA